jgi:glycosyltransferase involved in cell wall biosynthesis
MTLDITFLTTTNNGSYDRLARRQQKVLSQVGISSEVIPSAQTSKKPIRGKSIVVYSTFNMIPVLIRMYDLKPDKTLFLSDSALITTPYIKIGELMAKGYKIHTVSRFVQDNFGAFGIDIPYTPHFIPDPNPSAKILPKNEREYDFLTVGINEKDFDRKGHYWNYLTEIWGFKSVRVCMNLCYGKYLTNVSDEQLYDLYRKSKWYLAMSHAETPHLPLLESYAFGTPAVYLDAHEFYYIGEGLPVMVSFASVKGMKNFFFFEVHPMDFINAVGSAYRMDNDKYMEYANKAREVFEKEYKMENRIREFRELVGL